MTESEISQYAKIGAHISWAKTIDRPGRTFPARKAFEDKFLEEADGDPKRAESLRKAYFTRLALKSAQSRRRRAAARPRNAKMLPRRHDHQIGSKGIEHGYFGGIRDKSAITEGGLTPNLLPPIQQLGANGWFGLPYELTRVQNYLPNVATDGPGVAYFRHDSNGAEAAYTAEGATKPDISPVITEQYIGPAKVAGRFLAAHELIQDAGDAFGQHIVTDLTRSIYNATNNPMLNGTTGANGFAGINYVSGTLTRAADIGTSDTDSRCWFD